MGRGGNRVVIAPSSHESAAILAKANGVTSKESVTVKPTSSTDVKQSYLPKWGRITKVLMIATIVGYMIYSDQNLNIWMLSGRVIHLLIFPIVSLRDTKATLHMPTPVEYNLQTHAFVGLIAYSVAFWFLLMHPSNPIAMWMSSFSRTQQYFALSVAGGFENNDKLFTLCFCQPFDYSNKKVFDRLYEEFALPITLLTLLLMQSSNILLDYNDYTTYVIAAFFAYRVVILIKDYRSAASLTSQTVPGELIITKGVERGPYVADSPYNNTNVWRIYGNEYDVTDFIHQHPGGVESIMLGANRDDCTALFQSYHAFSIHKAKAVLEKYRITPADEKAATKSKIETTVGHHNDLFYEELVKRVTKTLRDNNIDPIKNRYASYGRYFVYAVVMTCIFTSGYYHCKGSLLGSFLFGVSGAYMGANIGHDGGHYAISSIPLINDIFVWGIGLICNPIIWQHQHTYAHHSYTNQHDFDPDLHHFHILMRYSPLDKLLPWYKMQIHALYVLWSFGWTDFGTCYWNAWRFVFERSLHGAVEWTDRKRWGRTALLLFHLAGYFTLVYIVPFFVHQRGWVAFAAGVIHMSTSGFIFGVFSQVGHITELAMARDREKSKEPRHAIAKVSWAAEQVETTNDYCPQSRFWFLFGLLLNVQCEHHLFPSLNHCHLQLIQPTVEQCCKEYNVEYRKYNSFNELLKDTLGYIQSLGYDNEAKTKKIQ